MCYPSVRLLVLSLALVARAEPSQAQAVPAPHPSVLRAAAPVPPPGTMVRADPAPAQRGLLLGALIGGAIAGFLGHRVCRAYNATADDGCVGDTLWWVTGGAVLGGLIGASGGADD